MGKSTLFNVLAGEMISIVKDTPGVTRDRIYADVTWLDKEFTLIDTGGIEPDSRDVILSQMREQAQIAIETADVIIFITDVRQGLVDADSKVADMLRRSGKRLSLLLTKLIILRNICRMSMSFIIWASRSGSDLGGFPTGYRGYARSSAENFPEGSGEEEEDDRPRIAIVGKPTWEKSSIINKLLGENRVIVSDIAGTTRDAIDTEIVHDGKEYILLIQRGFAARVALKKNWSGTVSSAQ